LEKLAEYQHTYLVTARHSIEQARVENAQLCIRLNKADGTSAVLNIERSAEWIVDDDDPGSDAALIQVGNLHTLGIEFKTIPRGLLVTEAIVEEHGIGIGDDLAVVGLFTKRAGTTRNHPIVRTGVIAAMPGEPLTNRLTNAPFDGYLMELRSIGGLRV
jgi:hypothetical protein